MQAIEMAANAAPDGANSTFALGVKSTGATAGIVYLHSEADYRDQTNVSVTIEPAAAKALNLKYGSPPETYFTGRALL
jgi:hypothetical protein